MQVSIVDYGLSNLLSVQRAVEKLGHQPLLVNTHEAVQNAGCLLLPGVGAFRDGMAGLDTLGLSPAMQAAAKKGIPLLGICLGMQMLLEESEEFGTHKGLGLIPGKVVRIPGLTAGGQRQRVPHVGWNSLLPPKEQEVFASPLLAGTEPGEEVYFVHSYEAVPTNTAHRVADTLYGGRRVCAAVGHSNVFGTQFHPEKSGKAGLSILASFLQYAEKPPQS